jgi:hypothetical protein
MTTYELVTILVILVGIPLATWAGVRMLRGRR